MIYSYNGLPRSLSNHALYDIFIQWPTTHPLKSCSIDDIFIQWPTTQPLQSCSKWYVHTMAYHASYPIMLYRWYIHAMTYHTSELIIQQMSIVMSSLKNKQYMTFIVSLRVLLIHQLKSTELSNDIHISLVWIGQYLIRHIGKSPTWCTGEK